MSRTILVQNRKALFEYQVVDRLEAGIVLVGSEVKSLRARHGSLASAFIGPVGGELFLQGSHISLYAGSSHFSHEPVRHRKLLVHRKQMNRLMGKVSQKGMTLIPLSLYLNEAGRIKVEVALAMGRKQHDKRELLKERQWKRDQHRILKSTPSA